MVLLIRVSWEQLATPANDAPFETSLIVQIESYIKSLVGRVLKP